MKSAQLADIISGQLVGDNVEFSGVSIDTRTLAPGNLFIAIRGERYDGHDFIKAAVTAGASVIITERIIESVSVPQISVSNARIALGKFAAFHRAQFDIPIIGLTGSCGKTTTRAMVQSILSQQGNVLASQRSYNNDIGVPLTLLQLDDTYDYAVIEIGANHMGEIAQLSQWVKPRVALITLAAEAHLAGFGSLENVAKGKGEIFQGLSDKGVAVINADDPFAAYWKGLVSEHTVITFGLENKATVVAQDIITNPKGYCHFVLHAPADDISIELPIMGLHNVKNALAAAAVAISLDIPLKSIKVGLESASAVSGRLVEKTGALGSTIIDDSYNANPASVAAAIAILSKCDGQSILVLGDMLELGDQSVDMHAKLGRLALDKGVDCLYGYGPNMQHAVKAFGAHAQHFESQAALIKALKSQLTQDTTVLIKGSHSMNMQAIVKALVK